MTRLKQTLLFLIFFSPLLGADRGQAASSLQITPETFDFGWAPDNAFISCDFIFKNTGGPVIPLTSVQPSCGCTATDFTPDGLASAEEKKIHITFNTRGYEGVKFNKSVQVKAGEPEENYVVHLAGFVQDPNADVVPEGEGVVAFSKDSDSQQSITIHNKSSQAVSLLVVQEPAAWVKLKLPKGKIEPGRSGALEVKASGSFEEEKNTSVTFDVQGSSLTPRLTLAIRTGAPPAPYRRIRNAPKASSPAVSPTPRPTTPEKK